MSDSLKLLSKRSFDGLAPISETLLGDQLIDAIHQIGLDRQCNLCFGHNDSSMT
jgi:hypothetical protein